MKKLLATTMALAMPVMAMAGAEGIWQTEPNSEGVSGLVQIQPCGDAICGVMVGNTAGTDTYKGQTIVSGMTQVDETHWDNGKITDPTENKTYKSKMTLNGDTLVVEGCVIGICRGQNWKRVQ